MALKINNPPFAAGTTLPSAPPHGFFAYQPNASNPWFGIASGSNFYGISGATPGPPGIATVGGYYAGMGIGGLTTNDGQPIFGVLNSSQSANGLGHTALTIYDNNLMETFNNVVDDGSGNRKTNPALTSLAGTAGTIQWAQPEQGTRKVFIAYADAYAEDNTTNQTITFPTPYTYTPVITTDTTGLTLAVSTTELTITAPDTTTTYTGVIEVVGI